MLVSTLIGIFVFPVVGSRQQNHALHFSVINFSVMLSRPRADLEPWIDRKVAFRRR